MQHHARKPAVLATSACTVLDRRQAKCSSWLTAGAWLCNVSKPLWLMPVVHQEEGMVTAKGSSKQGRLKPDMLANAILEASSPLPYVHLPLAPLHAALPLFLVTLPAPSVCVATVVVHDALPMLQIVTPSSCTAPLCNCLVWSRHVADNQGQQANWHSTDRICEWAA